MTETLKTRDKFLQKILPGVCFGIILMITLKYMFLMKAEGSTPQSNGITLAGAANLTNKFEQKGKQANYRINSAEKFIKNRMGKAKENWDKSVQSRKIFERNNTIPGNNGVPESHGRRVLWDHWYANFDCPYMLKRIGDIGDGGKWICGFEEIKNQANCTVFSFLATSETDTSFQEEILNTTSNCNVYIFNPSLRKFQIPEFVGKYRNRTFLYQVGLRGSKHSSFGDDNSLTLKKIMKKIGIHFIDILTLDIEGSEIQALLTAITNFPQGLPFGQMDIVMHAQAFHSHNIKVNQWRDKFEQIGLRPFHFQPILSLPVDPKSFAQYSFLNIKSPIFEIAKK